MEFIDKDFELLGNQLEIILNQFDKDELIRMVVDQMTAEEIMTQIMAMTGLDEEVSDEEFMKAIREGYLDDLL